MGSGGGPTRGSHEETLALVRRLPTTSAGWVHSRPVAAVPGMRRAFKRTWAEVRGSTLLLYAVPPYSTAATGDAVAADTPPDAVALIGLKDCRVKMEAVKFRLKTKHPVPTDAGAGALGIGIELQLADKDMTVAWNQAITAAGTTRAIGLSDFEVLKPIGRGASGRVFLVREKNGDEDLALKVIEKESVYENDDAFRHALDERMVLELACEHPFILKMRHAFQTSKRLYIVTEFAKGGDLFDFLKKRGKPFTEQIVVRMAGEMLLALQHIHKLGVVYRDLKLENVLLDVNGHIRIADFGLSKMLGKPRKSTEPGVLDDGGGYGQDQDIGMTRTFCGTREMIAPEALSGAAYGLSVDVWAFGILVYETMAGRTPFYSKNRDEVYDRIESAPLRFPRHFSAEAVSLLRGLLDRNPKTRLGMGSDGLDAVKRHAFFRTVDWDGLYNMEPHPDNIDVVGTLGLPDRGKIQAIKKPSANSAAGREIADVLSAEDEAGAARGSKQNLFSRFSAGKNKVSSIAGYSFTSVPKTSDVHLSQVPSGLSSAPASVATSSARSTPRTTLSSAPASSMSQPAPPAHRPTPSPPPPPTAVKPDSLREAMLAAKDARGAAAGGTAPAERLANPSVPGRSPTPPTDAARVTSARSPTPPPTDEGGRPDTDRVRGQDALVRNSSNRPGTGVAAAAAAAAAAEPASGSRPRPPTPPPMRRVPSRRAPLPPKPEDVGGAGSAYAPASPLPVRQEPLPAESAARSGWAQRLAQAEAAPAPPSTAPTGRQWSDVPSSQDDELLRQQELQRRRLEKRAELDSRRAAAAAGAVGGRAPVERPPPPRDAPPPAPTPVGDYYTPSSSSRSAHPHTLQSSASVHQPSGYDSRGRQSPGLPSSSSVRQLPSDGGRGMPNIDDIRALAAQLSRDQGGGGRNVAPAYDSRGAAGQGHTSSRSRREPQPHPSAYSGGRGMEARTRSERHTPRVPDGPAVDDGRSRGGLARVTSVGPLSSSSRGTPYVVSPGSGAGRSGGGGGGRGSDRPDVAVRTVPASNGLVRVTSVGPLPRQSPSANALYGRTSSNKHQSVPFGSPADALKKSASSRTAATPAPGSTSQRRHW